MKEDPDSFIALSYAGRAAMLLDDYPAVANFDVVCALKASADELSTDDIIAKMVGRTLTNVYPERNAGMLR